MVIDMTREESLSQLDSLRAAREAGEAAIKATPGAIKTALIEGITAAEIGRRLGVSEGYVRGIRRKEGLQDERYAHLKPPTAAASERQDQATTAVDSLAPVTVQRLAAIAEEDAPDGWAQRITAGAPTKRHPYLIVAAALADGYLTQSQIPH